MIQGADRRRCGLMDDQKAPENPPTTSGRWEKLLAGEVEGQPASGKRLSIWAETRNVIRRRIIAGILFLIPIATTVWFLSFFLQTIYRRVEPLIRPQLLQWNMDVEGPAYTAVALTLSILSVLIFLYLVGLFVSRTAVRRLIELGESLLVRIPFVKFFYKTTKQIVDAISLPKGAVKKVVICDFFRTGMKTVAFATGETPAEGPHKYYVNLFVPTTPNPTSGYLVMLPPEEVYETDLSLEEATRLIVSGGILPPEKIRFLPYVPINRQNEALEEPAEAKSYEVSAK